MFSKLFGKGKPPVVPAPKDAVDSRGLEAIEYDADTAWSLWDEAHAEQDSRLLLDASADIPLPLIIGVDEDHLVELEAPTTPVKLQERSPEIRKNDALAIVELHHQRIAKTIRTLWGYKECSLYINKLILAGGDGMGHARVGFNQDAVVAMLELADLHDKLFGSFHESSGTGFGDLSVRTGYDGIR